MHQSKDSPAAHDEDHGVTTEKQVWIPQGQGTALSNETFGFKESIALRSIGALGH